MKMKPVIIASLLFTTLVFGGFFGILRVEAHAQDMNEDLFFESTDDDVSDVINEDDTLGSIPVLRGEVVNAFIKLQDMQPMLRQKMADVPRFSEVFVTPASPI